MADEGPLTENEMTKVLEEHEKGHWVRRATLERLVTSARRAAEMEEILKFMTWPMSHSDDCKYWVGSCICGLSDFQERRAQLFKPDERDGGRGDQGADQV